MYKLNRRTFLKLLGQGTAALGLGMGLSGKAWTQHTWGLPRELTASDYAGPNYYDEWEFYYPGLYNEQDTKVLNKFHAELDLINKRSEVDIDDLIRGKLEGQPGIGQAVKITAESIMQAATCYGANNPRWTDTNYANKTKWGAMANHTVWAEGIGLPAMPKTGGIGDFMVVSNYNVSASYYKPVYEGDTLYTVVEKQHSVDITPSHGSFYRTFTMAGRGSTYNQKGELVHEGAFIITESFRRYKDPVKRMPNGAHIWESPNWWTRPLYIYTDEDWENIISIWKNEKIRGSKTLYWDDVNIGDEPPPRAVGPLLADEGAGFMLGLFAPAPQWSVDTKLRVLDPKTFSKMVKNKWGIYILPENLERWNKVHASGETIGNDGVYNSDGRATVQNSICPKYVAGMLYNWMGDDGWLQRIGWDFMELPPGFAGGVDYQKDPTRIPNIPRHLYPALFDKFPYLEKVPYMRGKRAAWHPMEGDLIICRACVTDKYRQGNDYFVDLIFWLESLDKYLLEEGFATVKLPKR